MGKDKLMNFIALYNISKFSWNDALINAKGFFNSLGIQPNLVFYQEVLPLEKQEFDDGVREVSITELENITASSKNIRGLSLVFQKEGSSRWDLNFHYYFDILYPEQNYLIIEYGDEFKSIDDSNFLLNVVNDISKSSEVSYGFSCQLPYNGVKSYSYIDAQTSFVPVFSYENTNLWTTEVPSYLNDGIAPKRYLEGMLRLVYRYNFIVQKHLNRIIQGMKLQDWIHSDSSHGTLTELANGLWCWEVGQENLEKVNLACYQAELLISYKAPSPERKKRKLP